MFFEDLLNHVPIIEMVNGVVLTLEKLGERFIVLSLEDEFDEAVEMACFPRLVHLPEFDE